MVSLSMHHSQSHSTSSLHQPYSGHHHTEEASTSYLPPLLASIGNNGHSNEGDSEDIDLEADGSRSSQEGGEISNDMRISNNGNDGNGNTSTVDAGTDGEDPNNKKTKLTRIHQACINCGLKKQKCTGDNPCTPCLTAGLECGYKPSKKR